MTTNKIYRPTGNLEWKQEVSVISKTVSLDPNTIALTFNVFRDLDLTHMTLVRGHGTPMDHEDYSWQSSKAIVTCGLYTILHGQKDMMIPIYPHYNYQ